MLRASSSPASWIARGQWPRVIVVEPQSGGLAMARGMVRAGADVAVIAPPGHHFETFSRGVRGFVDNYHPAGKVWLEIIRTLAADGRPTAVIPGSDRASELLLVAADELPANAIFFERSEHGHAALMDKAGADEIARRAGVAVPWTRVITSLDELGAAAADAPWPCVLKPVLSHEWRARFGERRVFVVHGVEEAAALLEPPLAAGLDMLLCQYIPGGDDAVEEAIVLRLADGSYPVVFGCHKLRQFPRGFGATGLGVSAPLPETMRVAHRVLDEANFVGVAGVECKRHAETDERWFLEVNVRLPGQWGLGDGCGAQASPRVVAALAGWELQRQPVARNGVRFVSPEGDLKTCREILGGIPAAQRPAAAWRLFRPYLGAKELALFQPSDPLPGLMWIAWMARQKARRVIEGRRAPAASGLKTPI